MHVCWSGIAHRGARRLTSAAGAAAQTAEWDDLMTVEFYRIPALQLTLADFVWDESPGQQGWLGIVGLTRDAEQVVVTCAGIDGVLRLPVAGLVRVRRVGPAAPRGVDDPELTDQIAGYYPGDIGSARAAFAAHSQVSPASAASTLPYPAAHYEGLYGGGLDHVVDAVGGPPGESDDLRQAAMRRRMADSRDEPTAAPPAAETEEELAERLSGWYSGDLGHVIDSQEP